MSEDAAPFVSTVLGSGYIGQGKQCAMFEAEFGQLVKAPRPPLLVNSGTSAITLALDLCGVRPGDYVISTPMTCTATNTPIVNLGAHILWADVDPRTGLIDPRSVAALIENERAPGNFNLKWIKAIIAVDWGGAPCDYDALKQFGIPVIQDAAHRLFALNGAHGDYVCWSHQAIKFLTTGDGGSLLPPDDRYEEAKLLRWYGLDRESSADFRCSQNIRRAGWKFQSNDIAAAIGRANLRAAPGNVAQARHHSRVLAYSLGEPEPPSESDCWLHTLLVEDREDFIADMKAQGIAASPVHRRNDEHDCFAAYRRPLPGVDYFAARNVAVPNGWWLSGRDLGRVVEAIQAWKR